MKKTTAEIDEIRQAFNSMYDAIPKSKKMDHLFAMNEIHLILDAMGREAKADLPAANRASHQS